jgi:hypothetical protein
MNRDMRRALARDKVRAAGHGARGLVVAVANCAACGAPICPLCGGEASYCEGCGQDHCQACEVYVLDGVSPS